MAEWMDLAKDAYAHVTVKPGVRAFLKQCRSENRRMALVTSSVPVHCLSLIHIYAPNCKRHISTQASISNYVTANAWHDLGASRVIDVYKRQAFARCLAGAAVLGECPVGCLLPPHDGFRLRGHAGVG